MTDKVPADLIEEIVGRQRDQDRHFGRAVSEEEIFYILHPTRCRLRYSDLRTCPFSRALDNGVKFRVHDEVLILHVTNGILYGRRA